MNDKLEQAKIAINESVYKSINDIFYLGYFSAYEQLLLTVAKYDNEIKLTKEDIIKTFETNLEYGLSDNINNILKEMIDTYRRIDDENYPEQ